MPLSLRAFLCALAVLGASPASAESEARKQTAEHAEGRGRRPCNFRALPRIPRFNSDGRCAATVLRRRSIDEGGWRRLT